MLVQKGSVALIHVLRLFVMRLTSTKGLGVHCYPNQSFAQEINQQGSCSEEREAALVSEVLTWLLLYWKFVSNHRH